MMQVPLRAPVPVPVPAQAQQQRVTPGLMPIPIAVHLHPQPGPVPLGQPIDAAVIAQTMTALVQQQQMQVAQLSAHLQRLSGVVGQMDAAGQARASEPVPAPESANATAPPASAPGPGQGAVSPTWSLAATAAARPPIVHFNYVRPAGLPPHMHTHDGINWHAAHPPRPPPPPGQ
eukprot:Unigene11416_Nuclearia_a/m.34824 Unigene11416_Nuclearia_a/g.34824  ORF Unigene11416_Nuclearia_a/g.34824 Unigene11416_Nuclearia_a/m.34824 type:complete len:175 (+) Unigene11416_Nuclearia_a:177-701(+)